MPQFLVTIPEKPRAAVRAANPLMALGMALDHARPDIELDRLVCEFTRDGALVARKSGTGIRFTVKPDPLYVTGAFPRGSPVEYLDDDEEDDSEDLEDVLDMTAEVEPLTEEVDIPLPEPMVSEAPQPTAGRTADGAGVTDGPPSCPSVDDLLQRIRSAPSRADSWGTALQTAHQLVQAESGSAVRRDDHLLRFAAATGPCARQVVRLQIPAGTGIAGFCTDRRAAVIVQDAAADPRFYRSIDRISGYRTRSLLCTPVAGEDTVFGCLQLVNAMAERGFSELDLELLQQVADALADRLAAPA